MTAFTGASDPPQQAKLSLCELTVLLKNLRMVGIGYLSGTEEENLTQRLGLSGGFGYHLCRTGQNGCT
jgi:hypothetical protein